MLSGKEIQGLLNTGIEIGYKSCIAESIDVLGSILPYVGIEPEVQDVILDRFRNKVKEQTE